MVDSLEGLAKLVEDGERLRLLVDGIRDHAILMLDTTGHILTWNSGAEQLKGYSLDEIVGRHLSVFYTPAAIAARHPDAELAAARRVGRYEEEGWRVRKNGTRFWAGVVITALYDDVGGLRGYGKITKDLTEKHAAAEALAASEQRFRTAFEEAPNGVGVLDLSGRFVQVNRAMTQLTGRTRGDLIGSVFTDLVAADLRGADEMGLRDLGKGGTAAYSRDGRLILPDGGILWVNVHAVPLALPDASPSSVLVHVDDIGQRRRFEEELVVLAESDPLTGLANRRRFVRDVESHLDRCRRSGAKGAVLMLDLDDFKRVNDSLGHNAGDELIVSLAGTLRRELRTSDLVARLGGDEFAVLLHDADVAQARTVAAKLVAAVRDDVTIFNGSRPRVVTTSIGVAMCDNANLSPSDLMIQADLAMYDAKDAGRNRFAFYSDDEHLVPRSKARLAWTDKIEAALHDDTFELWAQPILNLRTHEYDSYELLLRMREPDGSLVLPDLFLYVAERIGLIVQIDTWVTTRAIDLLSKLQPTRPKLQLEVNLSGLSVGDPRLLAHLAERISATGVRASGLVFEITETAAVQRILPAREFADKLRELGCQFALDDFGAGFGSFYYLKHLPFDYVKIDGEFVANCTSDLTDRLVIDSVVSIARGLGKKTIAEFVADQNTLDFVEEHQVDYAQGYFVGRPVPLSQAFPELADKVALAVPAQSGPRPRVRDRT